MNKEPLVITDAAKRSVNVEHEINLSKKYSDEKLARAAKAEQKRLDTIDAVTNPIVNIFLSFYEIINDLRRGAKTK